MLSKEKRCPDCGKKLEVVYSGRAKTTVYMCMNDRCRSYARIFGNYVRHVNIEKTDVITLDNWM